MAKDSSRDARTHMDSAFEGSLLALRLKRYCEESGRSLNDVAKEALTHFLDGRGGAAMTYSESLPVAWLLAWRGLLLTIVMGVLIAVPSYLMGLRELSIPAVWLAGALLGVLFIGMFFVYPLVVRMMMRKHFAGFRLEIVRD
ncbi:MAG: hypothetical protein ACE5JN_03955 [Candidatus Methylomirabilia bacterium]